MHVVHLACLAPPEIGGIGQVAYDEVVGLRQRGVDARLISPEKRMTRGDKERPIFAKKEIVRHVPTYLRIGNAALVRGMREFIQGADIVHLHYPWYGVAESLLWSTPKKPVVVTFHMDASADDWRGLFFSLHRRLLQPRLLRHASRILVSSYDYAEHSSIASLRTELDSKIIQLPFALDTEFFSPSPQATSRTDKGLQILFVGGLDKAHHFKGLSILLQAMTRLDASTQLMIVGDGEERSSFEREVAVMRLASRVHFCGRVEREVLRDLYRGADLLAVPSTSVAEAFGLVALEAQACGVPVVASRLPGVRTVVLDGKTGLLVTPGSVTALAEGIERLQVNQKIRREYAKNARAHVCKTFSQETHIDKLLEVYQGV